MLAGCSLYFGSPHSDHDPDPDGGGRRPDGGGSGQPTDGGGTAASDLPACDSAVIAGITTSIVFDSDRAALNRDIYVWSPDGNVRRLTSTTSIDREPAGSPDGATIVFSSNRSGAFQLYLMPIATMVPTQLTSVPKGAEEPSYSHDGTLIAFRSSTSIYTIHPDGTGLTFVADSGLEPFNSYFWPHFSADDSELMFDRNNELDAVKLDGSNLHYVVNNWTTHIKSPAPSPNGVAVAYEANCSWGASVEADSIWLTPAGVATDPCGGRRVTPSEQSFDSHRPAWGSNDLIAFEHVNRSSGLASIALSGVEPGGMPCLLAANPSDNRNPGWLVAP